MTFSLLMLIVINHFEGLSSLHNVFKTISYFNYKQTLHCINLAVEIKTHLYDYKFVYFYSRQLSNIIKLQLSSPSDARLPSLARKNTFNKVSISQLHVK